jgi:hypothetical protein
LWQATAYDWRQVDPTIFGSLLEGVLGRNRRWELGAHYTHEVDIMKIVAPTIVRPWRDRIAACTSPEEARKLLDELCGFRVLDPACGCGNFLYIAYRELRGLEGELKSTIRSLAAERGLPLPPGPWPYYRLANLQGIDIENVAVLIARVTLWMGHRQMIERYGAAEDPLPLVELSAVRRGDALRDQWPATDCIVGNPPFLGDRRIRSRFGDEYVEWLKREFGVGVVDYWPTGSAVLCNILSRVSVRAWSLPTRCARTSTASPPSTTLSHAEASSPTLSPRRSGRATRRFTCPSRTGSRSRPRHRRRSCWTRSPWKASRRSCGQALTLWIRCRWYRTGAGRSSAVSPAGRGSS